MCSATAGIWELGESGDGGVSGPENAEVMVEGG